MRILFSSLSAYGHTYPLLPLAVAARDAGHEITFATGDEFHPTMEALGFEAVSAGMSVFDALNAAFAADPENDEDTDLQQLTQEQSTRGAAMMFGSVLPRRFIDDIGRILARPGGFDLVVYEAANLGAALAAQRAGIPAVCHGFGRSGGGIDEERIQGLLSALAAEFDLDVEFDGMIFSKNPYLDIYPPSLQDPTFLGAPNRVELRPVAFAQPGALPAMVTQPDARPLVFLTLGTVFGTGEVLRETVSALAELDVRVLVAATTVDAAELGELPDNVVVAPWVPQAQLFEYTDLVVHHGGAGTMLGSTAAGLRQLMMPQGADQFDNAAALSSAGAGVRLLPDEFSREAVRDVARALLDGDRTAVQELAKEIGGMPSPAEVARRLPEFAV